MKRFIISLILSLALHISAIAAITTMQLLFKPEPKRTKIMYIKPVKLSQLRTLKPQPAKPKPIDKKINTPKKTETVKPKTEKIAEKPRPSPTPFPIMTVPPVETTPVPAPTKKPLDPAAEKKAREEKAKITFLKKQPYFKNWSDERLKRLELPPGIKSWEEAVALTDYFDKQYNWTETPPELSTENRKPDRNPDVNPYTSPSPGATAEPGQKPIDIKVPPRPTPTPSPEENTAPNPDGTPIPWNVFAEGKAVPWSIFKEKENAKIYEIRFYKDKVGFIGIFNENKDEMKISVSYFPFDPEKAKKDEAGNVIVEMPEKPKPGQVKTFNLPLTNEDLQDKDNPDQDKFNKEQVVVTILKQYDLLER
jgi:hypothetical protein